MKNHHTNILLRNTLFTCISALTIGSSFILSEQTAHAEDSVQQTTKVDVEKSDESISSPEISQDKSAKDKSNDYGNIDKEQEIANNQSNLQNSSTHPLDPAQILDSAIEDQGSTEVPGSDNANDQPSVTVDKDNFEEFFTTHGDATYDQETGTVTLTPDKQNQVGNFTMNQKIDLNQSFNLKGKVNLGSKTQNKGGADGIGFAFHTGNTDSVGNAGGNLGIGGLQDALGFKLDTYHNDYVAPNTSASNAKIDYHNPDAFGWDQDPTSASQFGAFVNTTLEDMPSKDGQTTKRWWAKTDIDSAQWLDPHNLDGKFHDFSINYSAQDRKVNVTYLEDNNNLMSWTKEVGSNLKDNVVLSVTASTGAQYNLQQFQIESFKFSPAASVNVRYVNYFTGSDITNGKATYSKGAHMNNPYSTTQKEVPDYQYVGLNGDMANSPFEGLPADGIIKVPNIEESLKPNGTLTNEGNNGTVVYVYVPIPKLPDNPDELEFQEHGISETVHFVDIRDNQKLADDYQSPTIHFRQATIEGTRVLLYHNDNDSLDDSNPEAWHNFDNSTPEFSEVPVANISDYHVVKIDNTNTDDLTKLESKTASPTERNSEYTIYYQKDDNPVVTPEIPSTSKDPDKGNKTESHNNVNHPQVITVPEKPQLPKTDDISEEKTNEEITTTDEPNNEEIITTDTNKPSTDVTVSTDKTSTDTDELTNTEVPNTTIDLKVPSQDTNTTYLQETSIPTTPMKTDSNKLPQAGNKNQSVLTFIGLALINLLAVITFKKH